MCVVLCSNGYPDKYQKNVEISNIDKIDKNNSEFLFHAGTIKKGAKVFATGGRVLNFVVLSESFSKAKEKINKNIKNLDWPGGFYRKDIGYKVVEE